MFTCFLRMTLILPAPKRSGVSKNLFKIPVNTIYIGTCLGRLGTMQVLMAFFNVVRKMVRYSDFSNGRRTHGLPISGRPWVRFPSGNSIFSSLSHYREQIVKKNRKTQKNLIYT